MSVPLPFLTPRSLPGDAGSDMSTRTQPGPAPLRRRSPNAVAEVDDAVAEAVLVDELEVDACVRR
ncbi:hypothetical protein GCM10010301_33760 [Streptomyces plicatus]|nr:hypothetical protein GCM10010301_33760 [Streptomyces plicatus]